MRKLNDLLRDRSGGATVEFVIWIPFFLLLIAIVTDVSLLLNMRARMYDAANVACRMISLDRMTTEEAQAFALERFGTRDVDADVTLDLDEGFVTVTLTTTYDQAMLFGSGFLFGSALLEGNTLGASMTAVLEAQALATLQAEAEAEADEDEDGAS